MKKIKVSKLAFFGFLLGFILAFKFWWEFIPRVIAPRETNRIELEYKNSPTINIQSHEK